QVYRAGGRPFVDTYPIHGWGADGGVDGFVFARFSPDLRLYRARRAAATALELCALAALGLGLFGHAGWAAVAFVAALSISPFGSERPGVAVAAMAAMALAARRRDVRLWVAAGALAAAALFFTLDFGVAALSGGLAAAALLGAVDERTDGPWRAAGAFAAGVGAGTLPFALLLLRDGALTAFCRVSFVDLPRDIGDIWGLPAGTSAAAIVDGGGAEALALVRGETMPALFLLGLLATAVGVWAARALDRVLDETDRAVAPVTLVGLAALRGALGRADGGHLAFYGVLAGFPAAWLLFRAAHARRFATATTVLTATVLAVALRPDRAIRTQARLLAWAASRHAATLQALAQPGPDRRAPASRGQAAEIRALRAFMDARLRPGETFFDYTSEPALYFLLDRLPPVRYGIVPFYEPEAKQREVIAALERVRPPLAIVSAGPRYDAPDSISHRERTPLVAAYLDAAYEPLAEVAGRTIAQRRRPAASAPAPP
ncbi:MAG TPA: hypothetical protein VMN82_02050, partial [Thermoanaerobaculia bacterium]|nr:hypothetical protein [Thermoanaerobaculia bacterium]